MFITYKSCHFLFFFEKKSKNYNYKGKLAFGKKEEAVMKVKY